MPPRDEDTPTANALWEDSHLVANAVRYGDCTLDLSWSVMVPSMNNAYTGRERRRKSERYVHWLALVEQPTGYLINRVRWKSINGPLVVSYAFARDTVAPRSDVFNREKLLTDMLVKAGVMNDDSLIEDGRVRWSTEQDLGCMVHARIVRL